MDCYHVQTQANNHCCVIHSKIFRLILEEIFPFKEDRNHRDESSDQSRDELKVILDNIEDDAHWDKI